MESFGHERVGGAGSRGGDPAERGAAHDRRFELVYREYAPRVRGLLKQRVADPDLVEDLVQETFLRAYRAFDDFDADRPLWPWLSTIASRAAINALNRKSREVEHPCEEVGGPSPGVPHGGYEGYMAEERRQGISDALGALNARHRRLLLLQALEGWRYEDIADLEGVSTRAVKSVLSRARRSFRAAYEVTAAQRGLNVAAWPAMVWMAGRMRGLRHRGERALGRTRIALAPGGGGDPVAPALASQFAHALVVLTVAVGAFAPQTPQTPQAKPRTEVAVVDDSPPVGLEARSAGGESATPAGGTGTSRGERASAAGPSTGGDSAVDDGVNPEDVPGEALAEVLDPHRDVAGPEDATFTAVAFSPRFAGDHTVFAVGMAPCVTRPCDFVLFRTTDGGASWERAPARGLEADTLVLPPTYGPDDPRIFALGRVAGQRSLQVSEDGGGSFETIARLPSASTGYAAVSPAFGSGDPRILIGTETLLAYRDDSRTVQPERYAVGLGPYAPAFSPDYALDGRVLLGGRAWDSGSARVGPVVYVCRDDRAVAGSEIGTGEDAQCTSHPVAGLLAIHGVPQLRLDADFGDNETLYAFNDGGLSGSTDGGRTFEEITVPWEAPLADLLVADGGSTLLAAVSDPGAHEARSGGLFASRDGGRSWKLSTAPVLEQQGIRAAGRSGGRVVVALRDGGLVCSTDAGRGWQRRCPSP